MNKDFFYDDFPETPDKLPESLKTGLATASFIISMVNLLFFGMALSFVTAPVAIVLAVMSVIKHQGGKPFAIASIIISVVSLIICTAFTVVFVKVYPDMEYFIKNDTVVIADFEESGDIPEQFKKYKSPEYDKYWQSMGYEDFESFFRFFIDSYRNLYGTHSNLPDTSHDGEELVVLNNS
ncbi:MAG: hypothetical protein K2G36_10335 [Ruminococcus sp.]|nr:hypothetical protein [Ruminococcus sp.]